MRIPINPSGILSILLLPLLHPENPSSSLKTGRRSYRQDSSSSRLWGGGFTRIDGYLKFPSHPEGHTRIKKDSFFLSLSLPSFLPSFLPCFISLRFLLSFGFLLFFLCYLFFLLLLLLPLLSLVEDRRNGVESQLKMEGISNESQLEMS